MAKESYKQFLNRTLSEAIERIELDEFRKDALKSRWLNQLLWLEARAAKAKRRYYALRLIVLVGGSVTPALVAFQGEGRIRDMLTWSALGISQMVAISASVEELFGFKIRYRTFRNTAEGLKTEGWEYFQLTRHYNHYESHSEAYGEFAGRVEGLIQQDIEGYFAQQVQLDSSNHTHVSLESPSISSSSSGRNSK